MAQKPQSEDQEFLASYQVIKGDIKKVAITNLIIILLLVAAYFINQKTGFIDGLIKYF